jgi:hypothetical protein
MNVETIILLIVGGAAIVAAIGHYFNYILYHSAY